MLETIELPKKDWKGDYNSIYKTLGASSHTEEEREVNDWYSTHPKAVELLCKLEKFEGPILEPFCGDGCISKELEKHGYIVTSTDLIDRGYGKGGIDFFTYWNKWDGNIISNPPYSLALECTENSLNIIPEDKKVAMFLKIQFLEGKERRKFFDKDPPIRVWVATSRLVCAKNSDFEKYKSSAVCYCWYIWCRKTQKENKEKYGEFKTEIKWFN
jgi:hypothetical protein